MPWRNNRWHKLPISPFVPLIPIRVWYPVKTTSTWIDWQHGRQHLAAVAAAAAAAAVPMILTAAEYKPRWNGSMWRAWPRMPIAEKDWAINFWLPCGTVPCLCHVVRAFEDPNILVHGNNDNEDADDTNGGGGDPSSKPCHPLRDLETIQLELLLADIAHVQRRLERITNQSPQKKHDQEEEERIVLENIQRGLQEGIPARALGLSPEEERCIRSMGLLTLKPMVYAFNVDEVDFFLNRKEAEAQARTTLRQLEASWKSLSLDSATTGSDTDDDPPMALVCAKAEARLAQYTEEERTAYLDSIGVDMAASSVMHEDETTTTLAKAYPLCYQILPGMVRHLLGYSMVYTGPGVPLERSQTTKAHLVPSKKVFTAYDLAGRIHGEIQRGFLRAQVVGAGQLLNQAVDVSHAKELGILRTEGKEYILQEGDVVFIQWKG